MLLAATKRNFDALAQEATDRYLVRGEPVEDVVVSIAIREELNPEEVKRLVERTNTQATLRMLMTAKDRKAEITLADYDSVLGKSHKPDNADLGGSIAKEAGEVPEHLPDLRKGLRFQGFQFTRMEKSAEQAPFDHVRVFKLQKKVEELRTEKMAMELEVSDGLDFLVSEFSNLYGPEFPKFANEAFTLYGTPGLPVLESLAKALREPSDFTKVAYVIDDRTGLFKKLASVQHGLTVLVRMESELQQAQANLGAAWDATGVKKCR